MRLAICLLIRGSLVRAQPQEQKPAGLAGRYFFNNTLFRVVKPVFGL